MASSSSQCDNVDSFLSDLSELSQKKFREDLQRQRDLQRNIDELRSRSNSSSPTKSGSFQSPLGNNYLSSRKYHEIPSLSFNRSSKSRFSKYDLINEDEDAPPMPKRPVSGEDLPPPMPRRREIEEEEIPPKMPKRPINTSGNITNSANTFLNKNIPPPPPRKFNSENCKYDDLISLKKSENIVLAPIIPVKSSVLTTKYTSNFESDHKNLDSKVNEKPMTINSENKSHNGGKYKSFLDLEKEIQNGNRPDFKLQKEVNTPTKNIPTKNTPTKNTPPPLKPKPNELKKSESITNNDILPKTPSKSTDWIDSLANSKSQFNSTSPMVPKPSYLSALSAAQNAKVVSPTKNKTTLNSIDKFNSRNIFQNKISNFTRQSNQKPILAEKPNTISSSSNLLNAKPAPPKPNKLSKPFRDMKINSDNTLLEKRDDDLLKSTIHNLNTVGKTKPPIPSKSRLSKYEATDSEELHNQLKKLGSVKIQNINTPQSSTMAEGLTALNKLRPVSLPKSVQKTPKPEAIQSLGKLKSIKPLPTKPITKPKIEIPISYTKEENESVEKINPVKEINPIKEINSVKEISSESPPNPSIIRPAFHEELSSLLKIGARSSATSDIKETINNEKSVINQPARQSTSYTSSKKLSHPNKNRTKGPKRRLPKSMKTSLSDSNLSASFNRNPSVKIKNEDINSEKNSHIYTKTKTPPPVNKLSKPRTLPELKPSRNFSGEIFI